MFIDIVKIALRVTSNAYNDEINLLMESALKDLAIADVNVPDSIANLETANASIKQAVITYCKCNFDTRENYEELKKSYDEQKAQLKTNSSNHTWYQSS